MRQKKRSQIASLPCGLVGLLQPVLLKQPTTRRPWPTAKSALDDPRLGDVYVDSGMGACDDLRR